MRAGVLTTALLALLAAGACGDGGRNGTAAKSAGQPSAAPAREARPASNEAVVSRLDSTLAAQGVQLDEAGRLSTHSAAGFEVYWPSGCGRLVTGEPEIVDPEVLQEFRYACDRFNVKGRGCSIYVLQNGKDENGGPPSPPMVIRQVEAVLEQFGVRPERQRPLESPGMEGVEVQAVEPAGKGEVWVRGLLAGSSVYLLAAWNTDGGLFEDPEAQDFFASFRLIQ
jgi:hypothetical protein